MKIEHQGGSSLAPKNNEIQMANSRCSSNNRISLFLGANQLPISTYSKEGNEKITVCDLRKREAGATNGRIQNKDKN